MSDKEHFTGWITRYALSVGIKEATLERSNNFPDMVNILGNQMATYHGEGVNWHRSKTEANSRAERMRVAKIRSLEKQIAKLRKLTF